MEVIEAIRNRRSIRGFRPAPVPREILEELLETCLWAPSRFNIQPWELVILGGQAMDRVKSCLTEMDKSGAMINSDLPPFPDLPEPYLQRRLHLRDSIDAHQFPPGTQNLDERRAEYLERGGRFHEAPNGIILCIERFLYPGAILDVGIMAQTICLAAFAYGLGTCIIGRAVYWPDMLRELLGLPESKLIILAIAIGYPNPESIINSYPRHRIPLTDSTHWRDI